MVSSTSLSSNAVTFYFFYRPKVQHEHVKNFHMLLVPRLPKLSVHDEPASATRVEEMAMLAEGADAVPAPGTLDQPQKRYRLLTIGKKRLPEAEGGHEVFWATVTAVGDVCTPSSAGSARRRTKPRHEVTLDHVRRTAVDRDATRKTRSHGGPGRLCDRQHQGARSIKQRHALGIPSHAPEHTGPGSGGLGIHTASSFVVQVKNPLADAPTYGVRAGLAPEKRAQYPGSRGRHGYELRFTTCRTIELLDYEGTELLMIAARSGVAGSDTSLGEHRGEGASVGRRGGLDTQESIALKEAGETESHEAMKDVFRELAMDKEAFPAEPLKGKWI